MARIRRVFVANRGEIAVRVLRACRKLGIDTVVAVSSADRDTLAAELAGRAVCVGPPSSKESYLNVGAMVTAALGTDCDAVHPGYGFLSEKPEFAEACRERGLVFVGPPLEALRRAGDKLAARRAAEEAGVPVVPGSAGVRDEDEAERLAEELGYPVLMKAAAGGGGRGMFVAPDGATLRRSFGRVAHEAESAFGDGALYLERYVPRARHVEVQILADRHGNAIHLGERDCSAQRRYQKVVEEAPAPRLPEEVRRGVHDAALRLARHLGYENAGTVEFLYDVERVDFYFMELNARLQVEHPVTEMTTGVDLVEAQLRVAAGEPLGLRQEEVALRGHAFECRVNAERTDRGFTPQPGTISKWEPPEGEGIRVDSHCRAGYAVPPWYDSLLGKLIVHAETRDQALERARAAVRAFRVEGVPTNLDFHEAILSHPDFRRGGIGTRWLEEVLLPQWPKGAA